MAGIFKRRKEDQPQFYATVAEGLKKIYKSKLLPLEEAYDFHDFVSPQLNDPGTIFINILKQFNKRFS